jgi:hypothetical protein
MSEEGLLLPNVFGRMKWMGCRPGEAGWEEEEEEESEESGGEIEEEDFYHPHSKEYSIDQSMRGWHERDTQRAPMAGRICQNKMGKKEEGKKKRGEKIIFSREIERSLASAE